MLSKVSKTASNSFLPPRGGRSCVSAVAVRNYEERTHEGDLIFPGTGISNRNVGAATMEPPPSGGGDGSNRARPVAITQSCDSRSRPPMAADLGPPKVGPRLRISWEHSSHEMLGSCRNSGMLGGADPKDPRRLHGATVAALLRQLLRLLPKTVLGGGRGGEGVHYDYPGYVGLPLCGLSMCTLSWVHLTASSPG